MGVHKQPTNLEIADLLRNVAAAYELRNANSNKFRIIAYERAADAVEHASSELKDLWDEDKLEDVPGVGKSIAAHLDELFKTGKVGHFDELLKGYPKKMFKLIKLPGIGPKTAFKLVKAGKIPADVQKALKDSQKKTKRYFLPYAQARAEEVIAWLKESKFCQSIDPLGSLRRQASTIGDIDIAVATDKPAEVIARFVKFPKTQKVLEKGETKATIILPGNVQVDLMTQPTASYGALLQHFTGSKHHNIALREFAKSLRPSLSLSEYGIKKVKSQKSKVKAFKTEDEFYDYLGLEWIPPELREDTGEIEAAFNNKLPELVQLDQVKSDLQIHSSFDIETSHDIGESTMEEIVKKAKELHYEYIAFTEHNPSKSKHNPKQIVEILKRKHEKVEQLNYSRTMPTGRRGIKVFNSLEVDILPDGSCPIPEEGFNLLDFALVSIHSGFGLSRDKMTKRVLEAFAWHPRVKILAHPTARKLNEREGVELDWPAIFDFCRKNNKWLEINADPMRLDLPDFLVREAVKAKVKLTLGTDAHNKEMLENMKYGVAVARRGWAEKQNIVNCLSLSEFEKVISWTYT